MASTVLDENNGAEPRLSIHEVPQQISRIFFGKPEYNPSISDSYGAPQAPPINFDPGLGYPSGSVPYASFFSDLELCMKLGLVALVAFIILVVFIVAFILMMCCLYCPSLFGGGGGGYYRQDQDAGFYPSNIQTTTGGGVKNSTFTNTNDWSQDTSSTDGSSSRHGTGKTPKSLRRHKTAILPTDVPNESDELGDLPDPPVSSQSRPSYPRNKRSRLEVTIGHPAVGVIPHNNSSEDRSQPRSITEYEVPATHRHTIVTAQPPALPPVPPPNNDRRAYSQIDRSGSSSMRPRLI